MQKVFLRVLILSSALSVTACSHFGWHHSADLASADMSTMHPLVIPNGVRPIKQETYYTIPSLPVSPQGSAVILLPPGGGDILYKKH